jgi:hypothetical protein
MTMERSAVSALLPNCQALTGGFRAAYVLG